MTKQDGLIVGIKDASNKKQVGGKAYSLGKMARANLLVPSGFVITTKTYEEHLKNILSDNDKNNSGISEEIEKSELSGGLKKSIKKNWRKHIKNTASIRSSATVEDSEETSFAGQFETVLNVKTPGQAFGAIKKCWGSCYSQRVVDYAKNKGVSRKNIKMAVIIQEMVEPNFAGVAFTSDPDNLKGDVTYIEWVKGIGDKLVSGQNIDGKAWIDEMGKILKTDFLKETTDSFSEKEIEKINNVVRKAKSIFKSEQDIEWATKDEKIYLLQSRPITASKKSENVIPPWILPGTPSGGWTKTQKGLFDMWDEYNPTAISPLKYELYYAAIWQASMDMLGYGDKTPKTEEVAVRYKKVPIAIDPGERCQDDKRKRGEKTHDELGNAVGYWEKSTKKLQKRIANLDSVENKKLLELLFEASKIYRNSTITRLLCMDEWIVGHDEILEELLEILDISKKKLEKILEKIEQNTETETSRMNEEMEYLATNYKKDKGSSTFDSKLKKFAKKYTHFEKDAAFDQALEIYKQRIGNLSKNIDKKGNQTKRGDKPGIAKFLKNKTDEEKLNKLVKEYKNLVKLRENSKTKQDLPLPVINTLLNEIGKRLVKNKVIDNPGDINLLTVDELRRYLTSKDHPKKQVIKERRKISEWKKSRSWLPSGFKSKTPDKNQAIIYGIPASSGKTQAAAKVVLDKKEFENIKKGEVIFTINTDPSWTQVFSIIGGIVVENGSRISHAAITAREFDIPAIVGINGITKIIKDKEKVAIDGNLGKLERLELKNK